MKDRRTQNRNLQIGMAVALIVLTSVFSRDRLIQAQSKSGDPATSPPPTGLKLTLAVPGPQVTLSSPDFDLALVNGSDKDIIVNLGMMLANGANLFPTAIGLTATDEAGNSRRLRFGDPRVAGRVDDYLVPIRKGSTYSVRVSLSEFFDPTSNGLPPKLAPGKYRLEAFINSKPVSHLNTGMEGIRLMKVWHGKLDSEVVAIEVAPGT